VKRVSRISWTVVVPLVALVALALTWGVETGPVLGALLGVLLIGAVLAAVHHAEVVAHRVGEPFGSLVLAVAVTIIEVALILELMASGGNEEATLARDTAFGAVMITTNGIAGLSLLLIAALVLLPETLAAGRAARQGRMQTSLNLAYGSAMASIGLTIPAIAFASIWLKGPLVLGLGATQLVLLGLTVVISVLTVVPGRATRLQGEVHLVLLAAYVFLAIIP